MILGRRRAPRHPCLHTPFRLLPSMAGWAARFTCCPARRSIRTAAAAWSFCAAAGARAPVRFGHKDTSIASHLHFDRVGSAGGRLCPTSLRTRARAPAGPARRRRGGRARRVCTKPRPDTGEARSSPAPSTLLKHKPPPRALAAMRTAPAEGSPLRAARQGRAQPPATFPRLRAPCCTGASPTCAPRSSSCRLATLSTLKAPPASPCDAAL
ncbi:MAG: hypothetical protein J3K34DRAFT_404501 [Monoraphidium minutum]|nr:MAG: hypothetical protein J3K34DRAFT_404501 [Monoraphidium minutum]